MQTTTTKRRRPYGLPFTKETLPDEVCVTETGCWEWLYANSKGYGRIRVGDKLRTVTRVVFEWFHRPLEPGEGVLHRCDNPPCVNPAHLFAGTQSVNLRDCRAKGRTANGTKHPGAKLTPELVASVFLRAEAGDTHESIARDLGVSRSLVSRILRREKWTHIVVPEPDHGIACAAAGGAR